MIITNKQEKLQVKEIISLRGAGRAALLGVGKAHVFGLFKARLALRLYRLGGHTGEARNCETQ